MSKRKGLSLDEYGDLDLSTENGNILVTYGHYTFYLREKPSGWRWSKWVTAMILFSKARGHCTKTSIQKILEDKADDWRNLIYFDGKTINQHLAMKRAKIGDGGQPVAQAIAVVPPPEAVPVVPTRLYVVMHLEGKKLVEVIIKSGTEAPGLIRQYEAGAASPSMQGGGIFYDEQIAKIEYSPLSLVDLLNKSIPLGVGEPVLVCFTTGSASVCEIKDWGSEIVFRDERIYQKLTVLDALGVTSTGTFNVEAPDAPLILDNGATVVCGVGTALEALFGFSEADKDTKDAKRLLWEASVGKVKGCKETFEHLRIACPRNEGDAGKAQGAVRVLEDADKFRVTRFALPMISLPRLKQLQTILGTIIAAKEKLQAAEGALETMRGELDKKEPEKAVAPPPVGFATMEPAEEEVADEEED
jgi:hypothetical protein